MSKRILRALVQATIAIIAFVIVYNYVVDTKTAENIRKSSEQIQKFITDEVGHIQGLRLQYSSGADVFMYSNLTNDAWYVGIANRQGVITKVFPPSSHLQGYQLDGIKLSLTMPSMSAITINPIRNEAGLFYITEKLQSEEFIFASYAEYTFEKFFYNKNFDLSDFMVFDSEGNVYQGLNKPINYYLEQNEQRYFRLPQDITDYLKKNTDTKVEVFLKGKEFSAYCTTIYAPSGNLYLVSLNDNKQIERLFGWVWFIIFWVGLIPYAEILNKLQYYYYKIKGVLFRWKS